MPTPDYPRQRQHFLERNWGLMDGESMPSRKTRELRRFMEKASQDIELQADSDFLHTYVSAANATAQAYVTDPMVNQQKFSGRWRLASVSYNRDRKGWLEVLRKGFADALDWTEAILAGGQRLQESESYALVTFRNLNPRKVQDMLDGLYSGTGTIDNAVVEGHTYAGTWNVIWAKPREADDGSGIIDVLIGLPQYTLITYEDAGTVTERKSVYCFNVPKRLAQALADTYREDEIASAASASYSSDRGTVDMIFRWRVTRTYTILNRISEKGCMFEEFTDHYSGYTADEVAAFDPGTRSQGWQFFVSQPSQTGDGLFSFYVVRRHSIDCETHEAESADDESVAVTAHTAATAEAAVSETVASGTWERVGNDKNADCTFRTRKEVHTEKDQQSSDAGDDASESYAGVRHTAADAEAAVGERAAGERVSVENRKTKGGKNATYRRVTTEKDQTNDGQDKDANRVIDTSGHSSAAAKETIAVEDGAIVEVVNDPTPGGKWRTRKRKTTLIDQTRTNTRESAAESVAETTHSASTPASAADRAAGTIVEADNEANADGSSRSRKRVVTPKDQTAVSTRTDYFGTTVAGTHTEGPAIADPAPAAGTMRRVTQRPTPAGNVSSEDEVQTPVARTYSLVIASDFFETVTVNRGWHQDAGPDGTQTDGTQKSADSTVNGAGKHEYTQRVQTAVARDSGWTVVRENDISTDSVRVLRNQAAAPVAGLGERAEAVNWNGFNRWDYILSKRALRAGLSPVTYVLYEEGAWKPYQYHHWNEYKHGYSDADGTVQFKGPFRTISAYSWALVRRKFTHTITYHASESAAAAAINDTEADADRLSTIRSGYSSMNEERTLWMAHKVLEEDHITLIIDTNTAPSI